MVIKEKDLKERFDEKVRDRFEKDRIPLPSESVMSRIRWAVGAAYIDCLGVEKTNTEKSKVVKKKEPKSDKKPKKEASKKKEPEVPNAGVSLETMGLLKEMTPEEKALEEEEKRKAAEERAKIEAAQRLEAVDGEGLDVYPEGHPNALVEKCKKCKKANRDRNMCKIYGEPARAWKHKSGNCPGSTLFD